MTASVGIAAASDAGTTADEMLSDADAAMYRAKSQGRARFELFDSELRARVHERLDLAHDLRRAIADDELTVHYQPMVALATGETTGFEALLRWNHPERGPISPNVFIPIAEETGSIVELGRWVLERACSDLAEWGSSAGRDLELAINLSPRQLADQGLPELIGGLTLTTGFDLGRLSLEVTETALHHEDDLPAERLWALKQLGVGIHLDDFGSGYSSLGHLRRFPIDVLKIDRSFVAGMAEDTQDEAIVAAILPMAQGPRAGRDRRGRGDQDQVTHLLDLGCRRAQGFLFAKPAPIEDLPRMAALGAALVLASLPAAFAAIRPPTTTAATTPAAPSCSLFCSIFFFATREPICQTTQPRTV